MSRIHLTGVLLGLDEYGQIKLRLSEASRVAAEELERAQAGRSPVYGAHVAAKLGAVSAKKVAELTGQPVRLRARVRRYTFRGRDGSRVAGWNLHAEEFENGYYEGVDLTA